MAILQLVSDCSHDTSVISLTLTVCCIILHVHQFTSTYIYDVLDIACKRSLWGDLLKSSAGTLTPNVWSSSTVRVSAILYRYQSEYTVYTLGDILRTGHELCQVEVVSSL